MLSEDEYNAADSIVYSAITAFTTCAGLAGSPNASRILINEAEKLDGFIHLGSKVAEPFGKAFNLKLPPMFFNPDYSREKDTKIPPVIALISAGFLGSIYELLKTNHYSENQSWQFFRHIRNACFHENKFHFDTSNKKLIEQSTGKLQLPAKWRGLVVDTHLQSKQLFFDFLGPGDSFLLVADIINKIGLPPDKAPILNVGDLNWTF